MENVFDSHAHLDDEQFSNDVSETIARAKEQGIVGIINPGCELKSSHKAMTLAEQYDMVYAAVGFHPHDAKEAQDKDYEQLAKWAEHNKVVAIGEIGLDYFYNLSPRDVQQKVLIRQLDVARQVHLPIIIHDRDAHGDIMNIVKKEGRGLTGVLHCYSGSLEMAKELLKLGFYISFAGPLTFKNAAKLREVALHVPIEKILIETDSPYLTPQPFRGKRNEPGYVQFVAKEIAAVKGIDAAQVAQKTCDNVHRLFNIS